MARLIVTRPASQASAWLQALRDMGHEAIGLPLIEIAAADSPADEQALAMAWQHMERFCAVMFVSRSAVDAFFKQNPPLSHTQYAQTDPNLIADKYPTLRFWATGAGTVDSLCSQGLPAQRIDAPPAHAQQFDSQALWAVVQQQIAPHSQVLIVRGRDEGKADHSRDWLAEQIVARGGLVHTLEVYQRRAPLWSTALATQGRAWLRDGSIWLLSSSQAIRNIPEDWDVSQAIALCTHARIAHTARERGFAVVYTSRPTLQDVSASIKSLDEH